MVGPRSAETITRRMVVGTALVTSIMGSRVLSRGGVVAFGEFGWRSGTDPLQHADGLEVIAAALLVVVGKL